ncbi:MAG: fimbrillin family protein [Bacteroidaceae bacterium]|nr:fimbrillin family protein [Bacteroidaceae bacterium]
MTFRKYIILTLSAMIMAGCSNDGNGLEPELGSLPLRLEPSLSGNVPVTKATGSQFEATDELLCYVRHVYDDGTKYNNIQAKSVTLINGEPVEPLYWDDFSNSANAGTDLRAGGHGLHTLYGYCYNGGSPSTALDEETGVLGWSTAVNQSTAGVMKANDLLWSSSQTLVPYSHARNAHGTLTVPFTHAMSKFTIVLVADEGFDSDALDNTTVTLAGMSLAGVFNAPESTVQVSGTTSVLMYANQVAETPQGKPSRAYEAVTVPKVALTAGKFLAGIKAADGNDYAIFVTDDMLTSWAAGIDNSVSMSGYNYKLTVTLNKQAVNIVATLADWTDVSASGIGEINFTADVKTIDKSNDAGITNGSSFSLWMTQDLDNVGTIATTAAFDGSGFVNTPAIYWPNGTDSYYFRALAQNTDVKTLDAVTSTAVSQGTDLIWGTTSAHTGTESDGVTTHDYAVGAAINPRTGYVPLEFSHAMSYVSVNLETSSDASAVDLDGAKVTLTSLYTEGTVDIATGTVTSKGDKAAKAVDESTTFSKLFMIPQQIANESRMIVKLADGTTYSLRLNQCTDGTDAAVAGWESGNRYTYTISLKKEEIGFRVLVQDWTENTGSGNAMLDWD